MPAEYVQIFGLEVTDDDAYADYRRHMSPLLAAHGGAFEYDFVVARVLKQPEPRAINRLFSIVFADEASSRRFFADPAYLAVRARHFEGAVRTVTPIAAYERAAEARPAPPAT
jgi:uncharacterized protein (DUF1330 family)